MSEMVERVARAINSEIFRIMGPQGATSTTESPDPRALARAAILAMREPPKGFDKIVYHGDYGDDVWRESINAALKD